jgi:hypothetical protein
MRRRSQKKNEEAKKQRLTWTKEMQARYSQEGRPYIFHLGGDTLKLQAFPNIGNHTSKRQLTNGQALDKVIILYLWKFKSNKVQSSDCVKF